MMNPFMFLHTSRNIVKITCEIYCYRSIHWHTRLENSICNPNHIIITSAFLGVNSQKSSILRSPKFVCIVKDYTMIQEHEVGTITTFYRTRIAFLKRNKKQSNEGIEKQLDRLCLRVEHIVGSNRLLGGIKHALLVDHVHVRHVTNRREILDGPHAARVVQDRH